MSAADIYTGEPVPGRGHELLNVQIVFVILAGIATLIRAYVKAIVIRNVSSDDYLIFLAMVKPHPLLYI